MSKIYRCVLGLLLFIAVPVIGQSHSEESFPRLIRFRGSVPTQTGMPPHSAEATFSIYGSEKDSSPLWLETQLIRLDSSGSFEVLLGSNSADGIPSDLFSANEARWFSYKVENYPASARILLISVPYALKAADSDRLGGRPASAYVTNLSSVKAEASSPANADHRKRLAQTEIRESSTPDPATALTIDTSGGTIGKIPKWTGTSTLGDSLISESNGNIGINNLIPAALGTGITTINANGTSGSGFRFTESGGSGGDSTVYTVRGDMFIGTISPHAVTIQTANQPRIVVTNSGSVGIGTSVPSSIGTDITTVDIHGSQGAGFRITDSSPGTTDGVMYGINGQVFLGTVAAQPFYIQTSNQVRMAITQAGAVGIGTSSPSANLDVIGKTRSVSPLSGSFSVANPPTSAILGESTATSGSAAGVVGVSSSGSGYGVYAENFASSGSAAAVRGVSVLSTGGTGLWGEAIAGSGDAVGVFGSSASSQGTGIFGLASATSGDAVGVFGQSDAQGGTGLWGEVSSGAGANFGVLGRIHSSNPSAAAGIFDSLSDSGGNILIGRSGSSAVPVFRVDNTGKGYFNGGTQLSGADFAESIQASDNSESYSPGDVLVIDSTQIRHVCLSSTPYSSLVAGVYSTRPGVLASPHSTNESTTQWTELPLAVVGIVPTKVSTENGSIEVGDLLVTSSTAGVAMKGTDRGRMLGAIIGKALQPLKSGIGIIEVLISLQ